MIITIKDISVTSQAPMATLSKVTIPLKKRIRLIFLITLFLLLYLSIPGMPIPGMAAISRLESISLFEDMALDVIDPLQACQLQLLHPFEAEVMEYFKPFSLSCKSRVPPLTYISKDGYLKYNETALMESGFNFDSMTCTYQNIWKGGKDKEVIFSEPEILSGMDKPDSDFIYVSCSRWSWLRPLYSMFHAAVQADANVREFTDDEEVGVTIIGYDSLSRLNFMRQMPKSYLALTQRLNAVILKGFNKVGENTIHNVPPILMGSPPRKIAETETFDSWPFIWKELKNDGMATLYGEDISHISTFYWYGAGFNEDPVNHYFNRFWSAVDQSALHSFSSPMCLGPIPKHRIYLQYLESFLRVYEKSPTFMFSLENEPSHDYINTVGVVDSDLSDFLIRGNEEGLFNRTILIILGDHGQRIDSFRSTPQGRLEDMMPLVSMVVPQWLQDKHPQLMKNLRTNELRLTSSYDLYSTFIDIYQGISFNKSRKSYNFASPLFGQSLLQPVPLQRTCEDAGIPDKYCSCRSNGNDLTIENPLASESLQLVINYTNHQILNSGSQIWKDAVTELVKSNENALEEDFLRENLAQCSQLEVTEVRKIELHLKPNGGKTVFLNYETSPNGGLYEGFVEWSPSDAAKVSSVIRSNRYGSQADCIPKKMLLMIPFLRAACYCG